MPLTEATIKAAKAEDKPYKLSDANGLFLLVSPSGLKSWRWKYRFAGKEGLKVLGRYPEMTLRKARETRAVLDAARRAGKDPSGKAPESKRETFEQVARRWHATNLGLWKEKHGKVILWHLQRDVFPVLGKKVVSEVKATEVLALLRSIEKRGAVDQAHRMRQRLDAIFAFAIGEDLTESNPAVAIRKNLTPVATGRYPALRTIEDARALLAAVDEYPADPVTKLASKFLAVTAARSEAVRYAEWGEIEWERRQWRIPGAHMKGQRGQRADPNFEFVVPLSDEGVSLLREVQTITGNQRLLFGGIRDRDKPLSDATISMLYRRLPEFAGRHVPHGWRSTFSTIMNEWAMEHGKPGDREVIDLMLAHVRGGVEGIYNRAAHMPRRRELSDIWSKMLLSSPA